MIDELEDSMSSLKTVNMETSELSLLVTHIRDYTLALAKNNNIDFDIDATGSPIIDLKQYIEMQKSIFKYA